MIGPDKTRAQVIAYWRALLARTDVAPIAHWLAKEALRELRADPQAAETAPITQADPTRGVDERS